MKNPVAEPLEIEAAPREVRIVRKGHMWVAVPLEEGAPLRGHAVRETTASARERRRSFGVALDLIDQST